MRVYLAGPINGCDDQGARGWREAVKSALVGCSFSDPMDRDYRNVEDANATELVERDMAEISGCDVVLAYCWKPSVGTSMEIRFAFEKGIPVYAVAEGSVSPWLRYHATVCRSLGFAVDALRMIKL